LLRFWPPFCEDPEAKFAANQSLRPVFARFVVANGLHYLVLPENRSPHKREWFPIRHVGAGHLPSITSIEGGSTMSTYRNPLTEYNPQMEAYEYAGEQESEAVFNEQQEMELAAELLGVRSEQEFENFLGDLISKAGKAIGGFVRGPVGKALGGVLKGVAKTALPIAGGALGTFIGGPVGTAIGSSLGSMAGQALGLELEGLSAEDREFEVARQFILFAGEAVKNALDAPPDADPMTVAHGAAVEASQTHAPGFFGGQPGLQSRGGRWIRRGRKIVLFGV
jgi:hypothetical protein